MIIGQSVTNDSTIVPLLIENQKLTIQNIKRLRALNFPGVYIKTKYSEDILAQGFINPELRRKITTELKEICKSYTRRATITPAMVSRLTEISSSLMDYILSKDEYVLNMIEIKTFDNYTYSHSINVATIATLIGIQLGYSKLSLQELTSAGLMHDLGKLEIPLDIINKPSSLTEEEYHFVQSHPERAVRRLKSSYKISMTVLDGICSHHEKMDGSGYPFGLSSSGIPLCGRILAVADVYDALTTARSYRPAWTTKDALEYMASCSGTHFDEDILNAFFKTIAVHPVGSMLKLTDDSIALVTKNIQGHMLRPVVRILSSRFHAPGIEISLADDPRYATLSILKSLNADSEIPMEIFE
jgi:HD-GYP domain-containing protein (c-di-GMP phosphodiesterase class II)